MFLQDDCSKTYEDLCTTITVTKYVKNCQEEYPPGKILSNILEKRDFSAIRTVQSTVCSVNLDMLEIS